MNSFVKDRNLSSNFPKSVFDALASEVAFENMPVAEKTTGNKNKLVCKMLGQWPFDTMDAFDKIEKKAGRQIFSGEFSRTNLRTITLLDDFLIYGKNKVHQLHGGWRVGAGERNFLQVDPWRYYYDDNAMRRVLMARSSVRVNVCLPGEWEFLSRENYYTSGRACLIYTCK